MDKCRLLTLGSISAVLLVVGIITSLLCYFSIQKIVDGIAGEGDFDAIKVSSDSLLWLAGVLFIAPAVIGLIASACQNRCMYILSIIAFILFLIVTVILVLVAGWTAIFLVIGAKGINDNCENVTTDQSTMCTCKDINDDYTKGTGFNDCDSLVSVFSMILGAVAMLVIGMFLLLTQIIISCFFCCRPSDHQQGMVVRQQDSTMVPLKEGAPPPYA